MFASRCPPNVETPLAAGRAGPPILRPKVSRTGHHYPTPRMTPGLYGAPIRARSSLARITFEKAGGPFSRPTMAQVLLRYLNLGPDEGRPGGRRASRCPRSSSHRHRTPPEPNFTLSDRQSGSLSAPDRSRRGGGIKGLYLTLNPSDQFPPVRGRRREDAWMPYVGVGGVGAPR